MGTSILHKLGKRMIIFRGFSKFFSELLIFYLYFTTHILHGENFSKQKLVVVETPEWKFKDV